MANSTAEDWGSSSRCISRGLSRGRNFFDLIFPKSHAFAHKLKGNFSAWHFDTGRAARSWLSGSQSVQRPLHTSQSRPTGYCWSDTRRDATGTSNSQTTPSGSYFSCALPLRLPGRPCSIRLVPKPRRAGIRTIGPFISRHVSLPACVVAAGRLRSEREQGSEFKRPWV